MNLYFILNGINRMALKNNRKPVYGVGINDFPTSTNIDGKDMWEYQLWCGMLRRGYDEAYKSRNKTYKECSVEEYLHSFTNFYNHIKTMIGYDEYQNNFELDKDLLVKGNKCYSRDTIVFVPKEINSFLVNSKGSGDLPVGVSLCVLAEKTRYKARIRKGDKREYLGLYDTPEQAYQAYLLEKKSYAKVLADKWKDKIDIRVYNVLLNYTE